MPASFRPAGPPRSALHDLRPAALIAAAVLLATTAPVGGPASTPAVAPLLVHVAMFLAFAGSLAIAWNRRGWAGPVLGPVVVATAYGAMTEGLQALLGHRTGDPVDLLADTLGALAGAAIAARWARRRQGGPRGAHSSA